MTKLTVGIVHTLAHGEAYALPGRRVHVTSSDDVKVSNNSTTGFNTLTNAKTIGAETSAAFVMTVSTTADCTIICKAM